MKARTHRTSYVQGVSCQMELDIIKSVMGATGEEILRQIVTYMLRIAF